MGLRGPKPKKNLKDINASIAEVVKGNLDLYRWFAILWKIGKGGYKIQDYNTGKIRISPPNPDVLFRLAEFGYGKPQAADALTDANKVIAKQLAEIIKKDMLQKSDTVVSNDGVLSTNNADAEKLPNTDKKEE